MEIAPTLAGSILTEQKGGKYDMCFQQTRISDVPFDTIPAETNSNDFVLFVNYLVDFESIVVVAGINNYERFDFFGMSGVPVLCAVVCFHTRLDIQHGHTAQHSTDTHSTVMLKFYCKCGCVHDDS